MLPALAAGWMLLMTSISSQAAPEHPAPGVPLPLAETRASRVSGVRYDLHFTIPDAQDQPVAGSVTVRFSLADTSRPLVLDFAAPPRSVRHVEAAGRPVHAEVRDEHLILPAGVLRQGENEIAVRFEADDLALNRAAEFMYTLFVPARARFAFPCFDQPDLKARFSLTLDVPAGWTAVSNGAQLHVADADGRQRFVFGETQPISTYLFAFAAGRFAVEAAERGGRTFRMLHRETDAAKVARNRDAIFDLHASALSWLERYTGIPYPFGKFEFVLIPSFQFSGMEHPGAVYYNAPALLLDPTATQNQLLGRASLIAHETAHMWFGDLVTMRWFDDVWMKEVFANFMAAKIVNPSFPGIDHDLRFLLAHYPAAYDVDRTAGTNPIRQPLENLDNAGSLYGAIIYQKAPIVMRQLEMLATAEGLQEGLREYLTTYAFGNATWLDLVRILDSRTGEDLAAWSRAWVEHAGRPVITTAGVRHEGAELVIELEQRVPDAGASLSWAQRVRVDAGSTADVVALEGRIAGRRSRVTADAAGRPLPSFVLPNGGGIAYGEFVLDASSRAYLLGHLRGIEPALTRGAALVTLWDEMLSGRVPPQAMIGTLLFAVPDEPDELNVQRMLSYLQQAYWTFLGAGERDRLAPSLEHVLTTGLEHARTTSARAAWFNALRDTARTPHALAWLERVWRGDVQVAGLTLAEQDYITLALELAVRDVPAADAILAEQGTRIENADRRAQFEFVRPALSADTAVRDAFFASLADVRNRRREPWVLQALTYLHHPLRAATSERYLETSLAMLREIQRTGDIFFPKRWMDATLGGHTSPRAAAAVRTFLDGLPSDYPERLRRVILSSADTLFRASRLRTTPQ